MLESRYEDHAKTWLYRAGKARRNRKKYRHNDDMPCRYTGRITIFFVRINKVKKSIKFQGLCYDDMLNLYINLRAP